MPHFCTMSDDKLYNIIKLSLFFNIHVSFTGVSCFAVNTAVHPLFEYDLNGKNYDQNMTIFDPKLRLKYD